MNYLFLTVSVFLATLNNIFFHSYGKHKSFKSAFLFNFYTSVVWFLILFPLLGRNLTINMTTLLFGAIYGFFQASFLFFKMKAMETGPISVTTLIGNCSLLVSTTVGILLWHESINAFQIIGLLLLILSMYLSSQLSDRSLPMWHWKIYCVLFFLAAGIIGIVMKLFSKAVPNDVGSVVMIAAAVMAISYLCLYFGASARDKSKVCFCKRDYIYAIICGIASCGYNRINSHLAGVMDSIVFYPVFNGATVLLSALAGKLLFKERFTTKQISGFVFGILALALAGNALSVLFG